MIMRSAVAGAALALAVSVPAYAKAPTAAGMAYLAGLMCRLPATRAAERSYMDHMLRVEQGYSPRSSEHAKLMAEQRYMDTGMGRTPSERIHTIMPMSGAWPIWPMHGLLKLSCPVMIIDTAGRSVAGTLFYVSTPKATPIPGQRWVIVGWKPSR